MVSNFKYLERQVPFFFRQPETPKTSNYCLENRALGFPGIFYFHAENWGNDPIWQVYFWNGLKPPTRNAQIWSILEMMLHAFLTEHSIILKTWTKKTTERSHWHDKDTRSLTNWQTDWNAKGCLIFTHPTNFFRWEQVFKVHQDSGVSLEPWHTSTPLW